MANVRKSITLPETLVRDVERIADGNFSAFVAEELARAVRRQHLRAVVAEVEAETGPLNEAEIDAARAELRGA